MSTQLDTPVSFEEISNSQPASNWPARYAHFGNFLLDLHQQELYQEGRRLRVQGKVLHALLVLVSHAGEIVTREQVRQRLWPGSFLANVDANVNTAINKLRQVLGDSSQNPIYIETVPRRGYCFIAPVEFSEVVTPLPAKPPDRTGERGAAVGIALRVVRSPLVARTAFRTLTLLLAGMVLGALIMLAWSFISARHRSVDTRGTLSRSLSVSQLPAISF